MKYLNKIGINSKKAFEKLARIKHEKVNKVLESYNKSILVNKNLIIKENLKDIKNAKRKNLIDRLILNEKRIDGIRSSISAIIKFKNPLNKTLAEWKRPNGLKIKRVSTPIGVAVTIRGDDAVVLLKRLLEAKGNNVNGRSFDNFGNYSFGINEHIDIPDVKYDPQIGILGLGISVTLTRPGYSIRKRSKHKASVGKNHIITNQEAKDYLVKEYGVTIA